MPPDASVFENEPPPIHVVPIAKHPPVSEIPTLDVEVA